MKQIKCEEKICRRCGKLLPISMYRTRTSGFILNQCKNCESELNKNRRTSKTEVSALIQVITKSGKIIEASTKPIIGGRMTKSPLTDKVLYFGQETNRDTARLAFSTFAEIERTGITFEPFKN